MTHTQERETRWRLLLGQEATSSLGALEGNLQRIDKALGALYDDDRKASLGSSSPSVARWLGDIREFFPQNTVRVLQQDALERKGLKRLLLEPEMMKTLTPNVHLAADLVALKDIMPAVAKETARQVVQKVVDELESRLSQSLRTAVQGSLNRSSKTLNPKHNAIDWSRTIRTNLKHWQADYRTIIPQTKIGFGRKQTAQREVILCLDQSGSMGASVVYSGVFGAVMASLRSVNTRMVVFDTEVVDLSDQLQDPVDLIFGVQLGGGTDINRALAYCQTLVTRPQDSILVLISDLYEGGNQKEMLARAATLKQSGVNMIALLTLSDDGKPSYDHQVAQAFANMDIPVFACTPEMFPEMMSRAIQGQELAAWAKEASGA